MHTEFISSDFEPIKWFDSLIWIYSVDESVDPDQLDPHYFQRRVYNIALNNSLPASVVC